VLILNAQGIFEKTMISKLKPGNIVRVEKNELIPADGTIIEGIAAIDESAITGESAPVVKEANGTNNQVSAGTRILSDWIVVLISQEPKDSFLQHTLHLVERITKTKTAQEQCLHIFTISMCLFAFMSSLFLFLFFFNTAHAIPFTLWLGLFVNICPIPIGNLFTTLSIACLSKLYNQNLFISSVDVLERAGDVGIVMLDKTGTLTLGNRKAFAFIPKPNGSLADLVRKSYLASIYDITPEGHSILELARKLGFEPQVPQGAKSVPFSASTRLSGIDTPLNTLRKGSVLAICQWCHLTNFEESHPELFAAAQAIAQNGGTPLLVAANHEVLGIIHLRDILKPGMKDRITRVQASGIKTILVTGDTELTAKAIAAQSGITDYLANAFPADKLQLVRLYHQQGYLVAMSGDGINDAPALAAADIGLAMHSGTGAAKEAGNIVDLDSDPSKIVEVIEMGKNLLLTRGALTAFSLASTLAKTCCWLPMMLPEHLRKPLDWLHLHDPISTILAISIFNIFTIVFFIPIAIHGVAFTPQISQTFLRAHFFRFGCAGYLITLISIKYLETGLYKGLKMLKYFGLF
jgi:K+-transporting ATPase ATPase B chain